MAQKSRFGSCKRGFEWRNQVSGHGRPWSKGIAETCWGFRADIDWSRESSGERHGSSVNEVWLGIGGWEVGVWMILQSVYGDEEEEITDCD